MMARSTLYLLVGYRGDRGNPDKRKSKGASKKRESNWYQSFDLVERGSQRRVSHPANVWSSLKLSSAYNAVHCITDPRAMRAILKDKLKKDVDKNPGSTSQAQRQARNTRRERRRASKRVKKVLTLQKECIKGNKTIANVEYTRKKGQYTRKKVWRNSETMQAEWNGYYLMTEPNISSHGIKKFEIGRESMYLLHSTKTGV